MDRAPLKSVNRSTPGFLQSTTASKSKKEVDTGKKRPRTMENAAPVQRTTARRSGRMPKSHPPTVTGSKSRVRARETSSTLPPAKRSKRKLTPEEMKEKLTDARRRMEELQNELSDTMGKLDTQMAEKTESETILSTVSHDLEQQRHEFEQTRTSLQKQIDTLSAKKEELVKEIQTLQAELDTIRAQFEALQLSEREYRSKCAGLEQTLSSTNKDLEERNTAYKTLKKEHAKLQESLAASEKRCSFLEEKALYDDMERRTLHNQIQELKGNIRVFCRVRPGPEEVPAVGFPDEFTDNELQVLGEMATNVDGSNRNRKSWDFVFDRVFRPQESQELVFEDVSQLVQSAIDGYKVSIFAYGQTGSGKTYTMEGPPGIAYNTVDCQEDPRRGIIPRSVEQIFKSLETFKSKGWEYECKVMFVEIYNENLRDLLSSEKKQHTIQHQADNSTVVTNAETVVVEEAAEIYPLLARAKKNRSVGSTDMNQRSSRSHCVFQLTLTGTNASLGQTTTGVLNLIDLAGSERLKMSGVQKDKSRLKETQNINKSLSCLGDVITALTNKSKHVPYRNSVLTWMLKNCFGGDGKTLMLVNISPETAHHTESLCALRFASKVNNCHIGTAKKSVRG